MEALRPLWRALEPKATIFQSYTWNRVVAAMLSDRAQPHVVAMENDNGAVILPLAITGPGRAEFLGEMLFDYRDILAVGDGSLLGSAWREVGDAGYSLAASPVRHQATVAATSGLELRPWVGAPCLRSREVTPTVFLARHGKARKQRGRLLRAGGHFERYSGRSAELLREIYDAKAEQFRGATVDIFSDLARRRCMTEIAAASGPRCEVFTIEAGTTLVAALVTYLDPGVRRLYTIWNDPAWEAYSPGIVLLLQVCDDSLREGLDVDFLTGEQPHKTRFATGRVQLYQASATADALAGRPAESLAA
jgi:CelD/BcsL family acetyltransferase involved in cellulose biosynthesis